MVDRSTWLVTTSRSASWSSEAVPRPDASYRSVVATRSQTNLGSVPVAEDLTLFVQIQVEWVAEQCVHVRIEVFTLGVVQFMTIQFDDCAVGKKLVDGDGLLM